MKVKFLKPHLEYQTGEEVETTEGMANYWNRCGVAQTVDMPDDKEPASQLKAVEVIEMIKSAQTVEEVIALIVGDTRKTVLDAADSRITELQPA